MRFLANLFRKKRKPERDLADKGLAQLCTEIGFITLTWAQVELYLDFCIDVVFHEAGGSTLRKELPYSFSQKHSFLKEAFTASPQPASNAWHLPSPT